MLFKLAFLIIFIIRFKLLCYIKLLIQFYDKQSFINIILFSESFQLLVEFQDAILLIKINKKRVENDIQLHQILFEKRGI